MKFNKYLLEREEKIVLLEQLFEGISSSCGNLVKDSTDTETLKKALKRMVDDSYQWSELKTAPECVLSMFAKIFPKINDLISDKPQSTQTVVIDNSKEVLSKLNLFLSGTLKELENKATDNHTVDAKLFIRKFSGIILKKFENEISKY